MNSEHKNNNELPVIQYGVKELIELLWSSKLIIIVTTLLFALASVFYSLQLNNVYKADVVLESARNSESSLGKSAAQLGQLASLAGFAFPGGGQDSTATDLAIMESRQFLSAFIANNDLLVPLFAGTGWDFATESLIINNEIYDESKDKWLRKVKVPLQPKPSAQEAVTQFKEHMEVVHDRLTGLVYVSIEYYSPTYAKNWLSNLVVELNLYVKNKEVALINANIAYLEKQAEAMDNAGMKAVFYRLLEEQQKKVMLALSSDEYVFKTIDPAVIPEKKSGPKRAIICVLGTFAGFFLSIVFVLLRVYFKGN